MLFPVTKELKLSRNVILCLPLLLVPSILPVRDKNSSPLWRHMCPKNFSCLFLIVFMRDLSWFVSSNIDSFVLFSFHDILTILLNQLDIDGKDLRVLISSKISYCLTRFYKKKKKDKKCSYFDRIDFHNNPNLPLSTRNFI